jgi:glutathione S-transferase
MKLFGHPLSSCTRKVLVTLAEKGATAELSPVDLFVAEHKTQAHLARHPFGVVPVLDDDGFVLYESRAILRYLDDKLGGVSLTPRASRDRARMDQWLSVDQSYVAPHTRTLAVERILKKHEGKDPNPEAERAAEGALGSALAVIDRALDGRDYLAGDAFSLADISLMPYVASLPMLHAEHLAAGLPRLGSWWGRISARASWTKATAPIPVPSPAERVKGVC